MRSLSLVLLVGLFGCTTIALPTSATRSRAIGESSLRDNARAIALYARRKRLAEKCGVTTVDSEFETPRLPTGNRDESVVVAGGRVETPPPYEVLDLSEDAPDPVVKGPFRELVKKEHGDQGGSDEWDVSELKRARDELLDD
ncbi:hypothetical protein [Halorubrum sp. CGM4_25_10-8A]|uniref:hypothetical protein n=1 Tax=Halorubrum sp. CGM4_25_10-8A TaxID=2518116 RepID=UPI0018EE664C|nr:hypothetical protein [Halorubrum sp. CGM4_25_10-8A]